LRMGCRAGAGCLMAGGEEKRQAPAHKEGPRQHMCLPHPHKTPFAHTMPCRAVPCFVIPTNTPPYQVEPPKDPETYIHRSGRTGRAGHTGVCITLVGRKHEDRIPWIERKAGG
jgi:hypothetical protein